MNDYQWVIVGIFLVLGAIVAWQFGLFTGKAGRQLKAKGVRRWLKGKDFTVRVKKVVPDYENNMITVYPVENMRPIKFDPSLIVAPDPVLSLVNDNASIVFEVPIDAGGNVDIQLQKSLLPRYNRLAAVEDECENLTLENESLRSQVKEMNQRWVDYFNQRIEEHERIADLVPDRAGFIGKRKQRQDMQQEAGGMM